MRRCTWAPGADRASQATSSALTALPAWDAVTARTGRQQRFDHLGYIHGYQLSDTIDPTADGTLTEDFVLGVTGLPKL